jgi:hypothetical protein
LKRPAESDHILTSAVLVNPSWAGHT